MRSVQFVLDVVTLLVRGFKWTAAIAVAKATEAERDRLGRRAMLKNMARGIRQETIPQVLSGLNCEEAKRTLAEVNSAALCDPAGSAEFRAAYHDFLEAVEAVEFTRKISQKS